MARPKKNIETPGQEKTVTDENTLVEELQLLNSETAPVPVAVEGNDELDFISINGQRLTDNLEFLTLVRKATDVSTGGAGAMVTNEEGKPQPVRGAPVLTEHGWHVPG
ncbi:MAG: hypothetical protein E7F23_06660 [Bifidobacterium breve]|nr:hypothetical protein [Bifidobacterium breve]